ncbi:MAG: alpha/beta hydrolase-fold protein, partial [Micrococcales bacterium]|nr:alpha/beta hydrolase-fold protein [Micrococcales bacterium]
PRWVYDNLRAAPGRTSWAAFGYSAGGWCANMAAMLHPSVYATTISLGGYWRPAFDHPFIPFKPGSASWQHYDLVDLVHRKPPAVAAWTLCGRQDRLAYPTTQRVTREAKQPFSITTTILPKGGHNTDLWIPHIPDALAWLGKTSSGFTPLG